MSRLITFFVITFFLISNAEASRIYTKITLAPKSKTLIRKLSLPYLLRGRSCHLFSPDLYHMSILGIPVSNKLRSDLEESERDRHALVKEKIIPHVLKRKKILESTEFIVKEACILGVKPKRKYLALHVEAQSLCKEHSNLVNQMLGGGLHISLCRFRERDSDATQAVARSIRVINKKIERSGPLRIQFSEIYCGFRGKKPYACMELESNS